ncbi:unnamed protein product [Protopolystoma xenopodis]|uniref:Uncharacterized protein n=1 Tax=Protopolystoma xenopodis TaxID=117903 RepID=A0A448X0M4_9PLAT|nr:unnamed protein product [Protopolystoma xenopodis]
MTLAGQNIINNGVVKSSSVPDKMGANSERIQYDSEDLICEGLNNESELLDHCKKDHLMTHRNNLSRESIGEALNSGPPCDVSIQIISEMNSLQIDQNEVQAETEIFCGSCKRVLERHGNESYCTILRDHYLECFLEKEGEHVKSVKSKAALEPGQMYWCKSCVLLFEKPWSLFQHMADKARGTKVQRWEKKLHLDWIDSVSGLMAGKNLLE